MQVQPLVERRAHQLGDVGRRWLARLPTLIAELERRWHITVGAPLAGGTAAYVARARTADGRDAVLKLVLPDPDLTRQVPTMVEARGHGYARLFAHNIERNAMLIEALGPSLSQLGTPVEQTIEVLCRTLRQAWRTAPWPELTAAPTLDKARQLSELVGRLWEGLGQPCPERVVARALHFAEQRCAAADPQRYVVVHGDPHPGNALRVPTPRTGAESGFVFIDPDGFLGDRAYDLGVVLRDWCAQLSAGDARGTARRYCRPLAGHTGVDEAAIWQWGFLERVSTGLFLMQLGDVAQARSFLATAEALVAENVP
ncbi:aminoglycoside phosphotransferase family protein [Micromonospora sp. DT62]|uniref:aminoglycoside phosphotransferase family protein n=1 Tax=Micromonospora sp. DT62 TaxID=3416521 RepID=UPI003CEE8BCD